MKEYHKIQGLFKRHKEGLNKGKFIMGDFTLPEFKYLSDNEWLFTEKVDGMNIRVMFDGEQIRFGGKTDNAIIPGDLIEHLEETFDKHLNLFKYTWENSGHADVCFYGEGYGKGIQNGGIYGDKKRFILFDIKINGLWLERKNVEEIARTFGIDVVPVIGKGTLGDGIYLVRKGLKSRLFDGISEGIVAVPTVPLQSRMGGRIITKIKTVDFKED